MRVIKLGEAIWDDAGDNMTHYVSEDDILQFRFEDVAVIGYGEMDECADAIAELMVRGLNAEIVRLDGGDDNFYYASLSEARVLDWHD